MFRFIYEYEYLGETKRMSLDRDSEGVSEEEARLFIAEYEFDEVENIKGLTLIDKTNLTGERYEECASCAS